MAASSPMAVRTMTSAGLLIRYKEAYIGIDLTGVLAIVGEELGDLVADLTLWDLDIVLLVTAVGEEVQEAVLRDVELLFRISILPKRSVSTCLGVSTYELVLLATDVRDIHVVGGRRQVLQLLAGEDVNGDQVNLCVTVLAGLGGGHVDDLAWAVLDAHEAVLAQGRTLHREGQGGTGIGALEGELMLYRRKCQPWSYMARCGRCVAPNIGKIGGGGGVQVRTRATVGQ